MSQVQGISLAITLDIDDYIELATKFSPDQAICVQGPPGCGKSESTDQIAAKLRSDFYKDPTNCKLVAECLGHNKTVRKVLNKHKAQTWHYDFGIPVIMRRLSQLTEGDIVGIPFKKESNKRVSTQFLPTDWLLDAVDFPCILFLDERNRALEGVKQSVFELQDSKAFYGHSLHPETRVFVAENIGDQFNVQQLDPAEISRVALIHLNPSIEAWLKWATDEKAGNVSQLIIDFMRHDENAKKFLDHNESFEAGKKYQDRRAWANLSRELKFSGLENNIASIDFYRMSAAMVGPEVASKFWGFCKDKDRHVTAVEIVTDWAKAKRKAGTDIQATMYIELAAKLVDWLKKTTPTPAQAQEIAKFMRDAPPEPCMTVWVAANSNKKTQMLLLPLTADFMVKRAGGAGREK